MDEVVPWIARGGAVELWCDAVADVGDDGEAEAHYRYERSFAGVSGSLPIRVGVQAVAAFDGACPHLVADMRCGAYEARPRTCRIYPAEVVPGRVLDPAAKSCPPEAWSGAPVMFDAETRGAAAAFQRAHVADQPVRARVAALLGLGRAALRNEGFVVVRPAPGLLAEVIAAALKGEGEVERAWHLLSPRAATLSLMEDAGAAALACAGDAADFVALY
jgi:hypothetical protein